jgi:hypothetical protein
MARKQAAIGVIAISVALAAGSNVIALVTNDGARLGAATKTSKAGKSPKTAKRKDATKAQKNAAKVSWKVLAISSKGLGEVSGCAFSRRDANRVWLHNDSGDGPIVVPVDIMSGKAGRPVVLQGVDVTDLEDIAITATGEVILGDIGDNGLKRKSVQLYRFGEPPSNATSAQATRLNFRYPDGPHDAEALIVEPDGSAAFIITKEKGAAGMYQADLNSSSDQALVKVGEIAMKGEFGFKENLVSAADAVGSRVLLRTYQFGYVLDVPAGGTLADAARATPRRFVLPLMSQGEALCASADGQTLVTASESRGASTFALAVGPMPK